MLVRVAYLGLDRDIWFGRRDNMKISQPNPAIGSLYGRRIAYGRGIDANSLATTTLTFDNGLNLSNSVPLICVIKYKTGTYSLGVCRLKAGALVSSGLILLSGLVSGTNCVFAILNTGLSIDTTQSLGLEITTVNGSASTLDVDVMGFSF